VLHRIVKAGGKVQAQHSICTNLLAFLTLWRVKKYTESHKYAKLALTNVNELVAEQTSRELTQLNLLGIVSMSLASVEFKMTGDNRTALRILQQAWEQLEDCETAVRPLMKKFIATMKQDQGPVRPKQLSARGSHFNFMPQRAELTEPKYSFLKLGDSYSEFARNRPEVDRDVLVTKEFEEILFITVFIAFISPDTPLIRTNELEAAREALSRDAHEPSVYESSSTPRPKFASQVVATPRHQRFNSHSSTPKASLPRIEDRRSNLNYDLQTMTRSRPQLAPKTVLPPPKMSRPRLQNFSRPYRSEITTSRIAADPKTELFRKIDEFTRSEKFQPGRSNKQFHSEPRRRVANPRPRQPRQHDSSKIVYMSPNLENSQISTSFGMFKTQLTPLKTRTQRRETIMVEFTPEREVVRRRANIPTVSASKRNLSVQYSKNQPIAVRNPRHSKTSLDNLSLLW
jgi:hypothetical protein